MPPTDAIIVKRAIQQLERLASPRHWLATSRLSRRLGVAPDTLERALRGHAESPDWIVRYSYYPSGRSLEQLWGHRSNVGKQRHLPPLERTDRPEAGDIGPDNADSWIFISHNKRDEANVRKVAKVVQSCGFGPWIFQQQIEWRAPIFDSVRAAINECNHFIVYVSPYSLPSLWVEKELRVHFRLADQAPEKETVVIIDGDQRFEDALEDAIAGKLSPIAELMDLPGLKEQERAHRMLESLGDNEDRLHFVRFSDENSDLRTTLGELSE